MIRRSQLVARLFIPAVLACAACGSSTDDAATSDGGTVQATKSCQDDPRVSVYAANMTKESAAGGYVVRLLGGDPTPPARGFNTWNIRLEDKAGAPMAASGLEVKTFMPLHGHTSPVLPEVTTNPDGTFKVEKIYFMMPGLWEVTFILKDKPNDTSVIGLCIEG